MPDPDLDTVTAPLGVRRSRRTTLLVWLGTVLVLGAVTLWYATHPPALATRDGQTSATTPVGRAVYVGVYSPGAGFGRTLEVAGVKVHTDATTPVEVTPLLCRGGSISVTTAPEPFCTELVDPAGQDLEGGDQIVLRISADAPGAAYVSQIRIAYREGIRAATQLAGAPVVVTFLER